MTLISDNSSDNASSRNSGGTARISSQEQNVARKATVKYKRNE